MCCHSQCCVVGRSGRGNIRPIVSKVASTKGAVIKCAAFNLGMSPSGTVYDRAVISEGMNFFLTRHNLWADLGRTLGDEQIYYIHHACPARLQTNATCVSLRVYSSSRKRGACLADILCASNNDIAIAQN